MRRMFAVGKALLSVCYQELEKRMIENYCASLFNFLKDVVSVFTVKNTSSLT